MPAHRTQTRFVRFSPLTIRRALAIVVTSSTSFVAAPVVQLQSHAASLTTAIATATTTIAALPQASVLVPFNNTTIGEVHASLLVPAINTTTTAKHLISKALAVVEAPAAVTEEDGEGNDKFLALLEILKTLPQLPGIQFHRLPTEMERNEWIRAVVKILYAYYKNSLTEEGKSIFGIIETALQYGLGWDIEVMTANGMIGLVSRLIKVITGGRGDDLDKIEEEQEVIDYLLIGEFSM